MNLDKYKVELDNNTLLNNKDLVAVYDIDSNIYKIICDDYGQCFHIVYEEDGKPKDWSCGTYNTYEYDLVSIALQRRAEGLTEESYVLLGKLLVDIMHSPINNVEMTPNGNISIDGIMRAKDSQTINLIKFLLGED